MIQRRGGWWCKCGLYGPCLFRLEGLCRVLRLPAPSLLYSTLFLLYRAGTANEPPYLSPLWREGRTRGPRAAHSSMKNIRKTPRPHTPTHPHMGHDKVKLSPAPKPLHTRFEWLTHVRFLWRDRSKLLVVDERGELRMKTTVESHQIVDGGWRTTCETLRPVGGSSAD